MLEIELDGKKVEVQEGTMLIQAANTAGATIPHFCYHKKLSIAANCRMCLVEIEKAPKPMPACATPVTQGMVVRTNSDKAKKAQQSVMEFLLINHPLDCPICDQGGECQLQDLAVGYGGNGSRYEEVKRDVLAKEVGPLISMQEMTRCIQCTRCVRFGQEVAGVMELGMSHRGEHCEIETFEGKTIDSELSGNMIDICPVGALTSKPFRYSARSWELSRRKSISPHDSTGSNLIVQTKANKVMRVLPLENEAINECWIADRDRFSYEALNSEERLQTPMIKQGGVWQTTDWQTALAYVANGLDQIKREFGVNSIGMLASPMSTVEELYLAGKLVRGLGSDNIDTRLRRQDFRVSSARWLGMPIADLSKLQSVLIVGSNLRKDHPLFAQRIRQAARAGAKVSRLCADANDWALPITADLPVLSSDWVLALGAIVQAVAKEKGLISPVQNAPTHPLTDAVAQALLAGERKAILLGNAAAHHAQAEELLALAHWLGESVGAKVGYLTESANTVGAALVQAQPQAGGLNAAQMLNNSLQAVVLLHAEPGYDSAYGQSGLQQAKMIVSLSPFKANADIADVMLPISPFTETAGSFVNAEGRLQSFHGAVLPLGQTRPAWKVLRVLAEMMDIKSVDFDSAQAVLAAALQGCTAGEVVAMGLDNASSVSLDAIPMASRTAPAPITASIYAIDGVVRRAHSLQLTADARSVSLGSTQGVAA